VIVRCTAVAIANSPGPPDAGDLAIARSPDAGDLAIARTRDRPMQAILRSPDHPITRSPDVQCLITIMFRPWLSLLAWVLVVAVIRVFWVIDLPARWVGLDETAIDALLKLGLWVLPPLVFLTAAGRQSIWRAWRELGLDRRAAAGYGFGLLATLPMAAVLPLVPRLTVDVPSLASTVVMGPFAEEVLFRGFLLAFLVRRAGWSLPAALVVTSFGFGLAHVPQSQFAMLFRYGSIASLQPIVVQTSLVASGGLLFGWIYYRCGSLWPAIGLHACINLWWELTSGQAASAIASSDTLPISAAHLASFGLAVLLTSRWQAGRAGAGDVRPRSRLPTSANGRV
jgi:membrane protease YdiL (CAAX protease family)